MLHWCHGHFHQIPASKMVTDYQNNMKGVDVHDQMVGYYMPPHRLNKWWHHLFFFFLSVSIHNAYILAKKSHPASARVKWPDLKLFIQDLVLKLIGNVQTTKQVTLVTNENQCTALHTLSKKNKWHVCCEWCLQNAGHHAGTTYYGCEQCKQPVHQTGECYAQYVHHNVVSGP